MDYYLKNIYRTVSANMSNFPLHANVVFTKLAEFIVLLTLTVYYYTESLVLFLTPSFLRSAKCLKDKVILVTGGAGGVGKELVIRLAKKGANVVVWDNNERALESLKEIATKQGYKLHCDAIDITNRNMVYKYAEQIKQDVGEVDILINNAGIVCGQTFLDIPDYMIEKTYQVNILSHYWTTKAFLPNMIKKKDGHIVTVSSLTALLGTYRCTDYSGSKYATIGFHESLHCELQAHGHNYIKLSLVCPYFIDTGMFEGCQPRNLPMLKPKDVAKRIITAIEREEVFITMPSFSRYVFPIKNWVPAKLAWELMNRVVKGPESMKGLRTFKEIN